MDELVRVYLSQCKKQLSVPQQVADGIYISPFCDLTLSQYVSVRDVYCKSRHPQGCSKCLAMLKVAEVILSQGYTTLPSAFKQVNPTAKYAAERARSELLQMPIVSIRIGSPSSGTSCTVLIEKFGGVDYTKMSLVLQSLSSTDTGKTFIEKSCVQMLLQLAESDRERHCIRYAIFKASGVSATKARKQFGIHSMNSCSKQVEEALMEAQRIREVIDDLAATQDSALLATLGISNSDSDFSSSEDDTDENSDTSPSASVSLDAITMNRFVEILQLSQFNWFEFKERIEEVCDNHEVLSEMFYEHIKTSNSEVLSLTESALQALSTSREAYIAPAGDSVCEEHTARMISGDVVSDSESDDAERFVQVTQPMSSAGKELLKKRRTQIKRRHRRLKAKMLAERRLLSRTVGKKAHTILKDYPDIGSTIEAYVQERQVGADQWRRTGILTFDGNCNLKQKVTYGRIQEHLQQVYGRKFSYGTVIQLCVARNKRRSSAKRYSGVAQVTSRRARKGFCLRYNPDAHWSAAHYKGLNELQYRDGANITNINRDDAAGFRLDTLTTCKQHTNPVVAGNPILTTTTDYVNRHPSVLQTTSYNFSRTTTTDEVCVGIVKASPIHSKNACQHACDLKMLQKEEELRAVFYKQQTNECKEIDCVRVDGASDEGPSHHEVQYYWTERHILCNKYATLVTTRASGSSFLNRVELQNGCLALGHSNTFIPSTLAGSNIDPNTGKVSQEKVCENLSLAIEAYISRVDGSPCGNTSIKLYRGVEATEEQEMREKLLVYLKGSVAHKLELRQQHPDLYQEFEVVWTVRNNHMVSSLPHYIFFLVCCHKLGCPHPLCKSPRPSNPPVLWYPNGPCITHLPFPVPDPNFVFGGQCDRCKGRCAGHYKITYVDVTDEKQLETILYPPSAVLKTALSNALNSGRKDLTDSDIDTLARQVLLPPKDCRIWLNHLLEVLENRSRGAKKAAATRKAKKSSESSSYDSTCYCGHCGKVYEEETDEPELWVACDLCDRWYHARCERLSSVPKGSYLCIVCTGR